MTWGTADEQNKNCLKKYVFNRRDGAWWMERKSWIITSNLQAKFKRKQGEWCLRRAAAFMLLELQNRFSLIRFRFRPQLLQFNSLWLCKLHVYEDLLFPPVNYQSHAYMNKNNFYRFFLPFSPQQALYELQLVFVCWLLCTPRVCNHVN